MGKPPKVVDPEQALEQAINSLKNGRIQLELVKLLLGGASIEMIVEGYLFQGFQEGRFSPDVGLLIKAPLAFYIASIAEESNIPYRFFENKNALDEGTMDDSTLLEMMQQNNPSMFNFIREKIKEDIRMGEKPPKSRGFLRYEEIKNEFFSRIDDRLSNEDTEIMRNQVEYDREQAKTKQALARELEKEKRVLNQELMKKAITALYRFFRLQ